MVQTIKEGWLKISSHTLADYNRYPDVPISEDEKRPIEINNEAVEITDGNGGDKGAYKKGFWRKNSLFGKDGAVKDATSFYFRLTNGALYYTESPVKLNPLNSD